ncbi:MAG: methylenetetrahydrofolate--tRNA-(uracil(54)-C(5))-methyltransferase (FADH(2)-oxidizing) TrmFO [Ruminococcaceae bacterium]|nr:methylenetetrahydrofolate--tRNA-(uracil(54)-C(5))-methyltransferase (FADH(2)-oxidizing) TrmFO [Oscillospiraceae bacterium]
MNKSITVIGAGLAGCEAAWQAARLGAEVTLYEMKPKKKTPAHKSDTFAELVCSNSLRSAVLSNAVGLLKEELRRTSSLIMEAADACEVPAGSALAVDREKFSGYITEKIKNHPRIKVIEQELSSIPEDSITVVATGPLTSNSMAVYLKEYLNEKEFYFFDAAAPIVDASTINFDRAFYASRWDKGEAAYINCPMEKEEYDAFYEALINAKEAQIHDFDREEQKDLTVFEGCMPVEVMAKRGHDTLLFGPMKPVGLRDPRYPDKEFYAVVQLRQETLDKTMYNIVGFQTHLTFGEQKRVFSMIPGLENAEFLRYGVMHRNTYINSPKLLDETYALRRSPNVFFAGQMTGVEGYVESTASGLVAGINAAMYALGREKIDFPDTTAIGALAHYVSDENVTKFQPMNVNFGIIRPLEKRVKGGKAAKNEALANRALEELALLIPKLEETK